MVTFTAGQQLTADELNAAFTGKQDTPIPGAPFLPLAGGTMNGALVLAGSPTANLQAASKQYVDMAGAINVNTLTNGIPLVGDGNTANLTAWQNVQSNLYNLNTDPPVAVTLTSASPCVVNWTAHGLKPNQSFQFTLASGGTLPSGVTLNTPYFVTVANLTANTFTFSTAYNGLFNPGHAEGTPVATTGSSSGVQVVLTSNQWITLYVPPGVYATNLPFGNAGNRTEVELFPMGLSRVRFLAYGAVFDDLTLPTPSGTASGAMALPGPSPTGWQTQWYDYVNSIDSGGGPTSGNYPITLKTIANAVNYFPGQWIAIFGLDLQSQYLKFTSGPPNNHYLEYNQVTAVNLGTGVISVRYPPRFAYSDTFPNMFNGTPGTGSGVIGGGQALIAPMNPSWDMEFEIIGARFPKAGYEPMGRRQVFIDCTFDVMIAPHLGREIIYRGCKFMGSSNQIDKMTEYLEFDSCEGNWPFFSTSVITCVMKGCRGIVTNTPRNLLMDNCIFDQVVVGCQLLGTTDSIIMRNNRINFFTWNGRGDAPKLGPSTGGNAILANWTFSNGTFSRDLSTVPQAFSYQPWAIPGAKCFLSDENAQYNNMGAPFEILNVYMTGSVFKFDTTLQAIPNYQTSATATITSPASPALFTGPTLTNGTPVLLQTTGTLPTGFVPNTTVYYTVNGSGATFNLAATVGGAAINSTGTQSGTHTVIANPLHINIHPCSRFTGIGNVGTQAVVDMNGAVDEPIFSRFKRAFAGRQVASTAFQQNYGRIWGKLVSMTVNVIQAGTAGTVNVACPGFTQPNFGTSNFSQTIDLTVAGTRTVTPAGVTGSVGADVLVAYGDWICGGGAVAGNFLQIVCTGVSTTLSNTPIFDVEILTDQGITRFTTVFGGDTQTNGSAVNTRVDSSIQQYWPAVV